MGECNRKNSIIKSRKLRIWVFFGSCLVLDCYLICCDSAGSCFEAFGMIWNVVSEWDPFPHGTYACLPNGEAPSFEVVLSCWSEVNN